MVSQRWKWWLHGVCIGIGIGFDIYTRIRMVVDGLGVCIHIHIWCGWCGDRSRSHPLAYLVLSLCLRVVAPSLPSISPNCSSLAISIISC